MPTAPPRESRDLVLHIGSSKTGSKSIQRFLLDNRERLAELGYLYPLTPGEARGHPRLGLFIKSDADLRAATQGRSHRQAQRESERAAFRENFRRELLREIDQSGLSRVLLSYESLYSDPDELALQRLRRLTDEVATRLRLVVYLRRQDDHLISQYQQKVKTGAETRRMDEFAQHDTSTPYDYAARLRAWERLLEPDEFVVRRFEKESFVDGDLVQDFLHAADVDLRGEGLEQPPRMNGSIDAESVEFLRLFNLYRIEKGVGARYFSPPYNRSVATRLRKASTGPLLTLPDDVLDEFMAQWEESNRAVAQRYLGDPSGELFRTPRRTRDTTTKQYLDPARLDHYLTLLKLPERMHEPLRRLAEREAKATDAHDRRARPRSRFLRMRRGSATKPGAESRPDRPEHARTARAT